MLVISREKTANLHNSGKWNLGSPLPLGTKASLVRREASSAALAHCSFSFHIHLLSPLSFQCAIHGASLSFEPGGCEIHPHWAEKESMGGDPHSLIILSSSSFWGKSVGFSGLSLLTALRDGFFYFCYTYCDNLLAFSIIYFANVGVMLSERKRFFG